MADEKVAQYVLSMFMDEEKPHAPNNYAHQSDVYANMGQFSYHMNNNSGPASGSEQDRDNSDATTSYGTGGGSNEDISFYCKCESKCWTTVSEEEIEKIHQEYNSLNYEKRNNFIRDHIEQISLGPRSKGVRIYKLPLGEEKIAKVCRTFFKHVLALTDGKMNFALLEKSKTATERYTAYCKITPSDEQSVCSFVKGCQATVLVYDGSTMVPHILSKSVSISQMFRNYRAMCLKDNRKMVNEASFRRIVNRNFNIKNPVRERYDDKIKSLLGSE